MRLLKLLEQLLKEDNQYKLHYSRKYKKLVAKYSNKPLEKLSILYIDQ